jgi:hypothetical protein
VIRLLGRRQQKLASRVGQHAGCGRFHTLGQLPRASPGAHSGWGDVGVSVVTSAVEEMSARLGGISGGAAEFHGGVGRHASAAAQTPVDGALGGLMGHWAAMRCCHGLGWPGSGSRRRCAALLLPIGRPTGPWETPRAVRSGHDPVARPGRAGAHWRPRPGGRGGRLARGSGRFHGRDRDPGGLQRGVVVGGELERGGGEVLRRARAAGGGALPAGWVGGAQRGADAPF